MFGSDGEHACGRRIVKRGVGALAAAPRVKDHRHGSAWSLLLLCGFAAAAAGPAPAAALAPFASVNGGRPGGLVALRGGSTFGQPSTMVRR